MWAHVQPRLRSTRLIEMAPMRLLILAMPIQWLLCMLVAKRPSERQA